MANKPPAEEAPAIVQRGSTTIRTDRMPDGTWRATQNDVDIEATAANPARAVEKYAAKVAEECYE